MAGAEGAVSLDCFEGAYRIAAWHLNEARRFYGGLALPETVSRALRLDAWLIAYCRRERTHIVPTTKILQSGPSGLRERASMEAAARELEDSGRARLRQEGKRKWIAANPSLLGEVEQ